MKKFDQSKLTKSVRDLISHASDRAKKFGHAEVTSYHLLVAVLEDKKCRNILTRAGGEIGKISRDLMKVLHELPTAQGEKAKKSSQDLREVLNASAQKASNEIGIGHLILALKEHKSLYGFLKSVKAGKVPVGREYSDILSKHTKDLTKLAKRGKLDPVIGRDEESRRVIQTLCRKTKNNPVIIGESGVGKTSIVNAIAHRIASGDVPESLKGKTLLQLELSGVLAGAKYRGEFEERMKKILDEVALMSSDLIIFIDDIHSIMSAGSSEQGGSDAASLLKPALSRGDFHCIGATTSDEYRKNIEKDKALERRFQAIRVEEPSIDDAVAIMRGLKDKFQHHHGLRISDEALVAAVKFSSRYLPSRFLPDKAIDLVDEAFAQIKMEMESVPAVIDANQRMLSRLKMEYESLENKSPELQEQIERLESQVNEDKRSWELEKNLLSSLKTVSNRIEEVEQEIIKSESEGNLERAGLLTFEDLPKLTEEREKIINEIRIAQGNGGSFLRDSVQEEDIANILSSWTGIPAEKMKISGSQKPLLHMEDILHERVVGQHEAIVAVSDAIRQSQAGLSDPNSPIGVFLFLGPSGTGKTECAKALASFLFDDESNIVRIDMSEYMEKHTVSRLIGAPPGYAGHDEGGQLTEAVRHKPYSIVLLDEVEKAHPDVYNVLLQVFDEGRLTDSGGKVVNFKNTVILMTSNIGSHLYGQELSDEELSEAREKLLFAHFRPELLNRIDATVYFHPLMREHMMNILDIQMSSVDKRLKERGLELELTQAAREWLAENGYDFAFGARPLKRLIKSQVLNLLSRHILSEAPEPGTKLKVDLVNDELEIA